MAVDIRTYEDAKVQSWILQKHDKRDETNASDWFGNEREVMNKRSVSLTPGFSQVTKAHPQRFKRFTGLLSRPAKAMWLSIVAAFLLAFGTSSPAATNDPALALQKGLFEEEANHDFNAAIRAYQAVVKQFDQDRKLAATAVFRLGECYRKQGNTNEANV